MATQAFYTDAALTTPLSAGIDVAQKSDGSLPAVDVQLWFGQPDAGFKFQASSDPGIDPISISVIDSDVGNGQEASAIKLATTEAGLDAAVAGDPLSLGTEVAGDAAGAVEFWARIVDETTVPGSYTELSIESNDCDLVPV